MRKSRTLARTRCGTLTAWLDAVETPIAVQQKLMRHAITTTTDHYGDVVTEEMAQAVLKVAGWRNGTGTGNEPSSTQ
jgi:hypothetical protein